MKKEINIRNVWSYLIGNYRYILYYSRFFKWLLRDHIREQIEVRINSMDKECYEQGQCKLCGCKTTALQMASKACDKPCYPEMLSSYNWSLIKMMSRYSRNSYLNIKGVNWKIENNKFVKYE